MEKLGTRSPRRKRRSWKLSSYGGVHPASIPIDRVGSSSIETADGAVATGDLVTAQDADGSADNVSDSSLRTITLFKCSKRQSTRCLKAVRDSRLTEPVHITRLAQDHESDGRATAAARRFANSRIDLLIDHARDDVRALAPGNFGLRISNCELRVTKVAVSPSRSKSGQIHTRLRRHNSKFEIRNSAPADAVKPILTAQKQLTICNRW